MRILYSHRVQSKDGQSVHIEELTGALRRQGHVLDIVGPAFYEQAGFGGGDKSLVSSLKAHLPGAAYELAELGYNAVSIPPLLRAGRANRPDVIYERYNLFHLAGLTARRVLKRPLLLEVNSPLAEERARHGNLKLQRLAKRIEAATWRGADLVLPVTNVLADHVRAAGVPDERIHVVQNGIDPRLYASLDPRPFRARLQLGSGEIAIGFVGFVRPWHGLDRVLDRMARDRRANLRLIIAGDGPAISDLKAQAKALGIASRVQFLGLVERADIPGLLASFDVALQPHVVAYASPLKLFEYMAAARAIVAPATPNIREVLTDKTDALLVQPDDPDDLWGAITALADDAALRTRLGDGARNTLLTRDYTWDGNARRIASLAEMLGARHAAGKDARDFAANRRQVIE
ncbi:glycosyltransferase family 4 protein [Roseiterribacter gracilis]|uniref:Glycosyl transferase family 1 n=1 Tax=Roseiterribacter gracilis TaxID=2812848 RepID=A0A8S8XAG2_9PROT|nr:glycosyl transferase family 1 [Rhodospirillales bacterium TMPK1]